MAGNTGPHTWHGLGPSMPPLVLPPLPPLSLLLLLVVVVVVVVVVVIVVVVVVVVIPIVHPYVIQSVMTLIGLRDL